MVESETHPIKLYIIYASELGNCEQISDDLFRSLKKNHGGEESIIAETKRLLMNNYNQIEF